MAYIAEAKQKYRQLNSKIEKELSAGGTSRAGAMSLLSAKASLVVGTKIGRPTVSQTEVITAGRTPATATGPMEDAILFIRRIVLGQVVETSKIDIKNMSMAYADPDIVGKVLWTHPDIQAIGASYYDSNNNLGWEVYDGVFAEAPSNTRRQ